MTAKEAFTKVVKHVGHPVTMVACREYDSAFGFFIGPKGATGPRIFVGHTMYCVDKKDGHVYTNDDDEYDLYRRPWYEAQVS